MERKWNNGAKEQYKICDTTQNKLIHAHKMVKQWACMLFLMISNVRQSFRCSVIMNVLRSHITSYIANDYQSHVFMRYQPHPSVCTRYE